MGKSQENRKVRKEAERAVGKAMAAQTPAPWYESNLLWGGVGIVLTVVPTMKQDLRWLLFIAWVCFVFSLWPVFWRIIPKRLLAVLTTAIVTGVALWSLNVWLYQPEVMISLGNISISIEDELQDRNTAFTQYGSIGEYSVMGYPSKERLVIRQKAVIEIGSSGGITIKIRSRMKDGFEGWVDNVQADYPVTKEGSFYQSKSKEQIIILPRMFKGDKVELIYSIESTILSTRRPLFFENFQTACTGCTLFLIDRNRNLELPTFFDIQVSCDTCRELYRSKNQFFSVPIGR